VLSAGKDAWLTSMSEPLARPLICCAGAQLRSESVGEEPARRIFRSAFRFRSFGEKMARFYTGGHPAAPVLGQHAPLTGR
jgi:hypothetical protein